MNRFRCDICDYDLCEACHEKKANNEAVSSGGDVAPVDEVEYYCHSQRRWIPAKDRPRHGASEFRHTFEEQEDDFEVAFDGLSLKDVNQDAFKRELLNGFSELGMSTCAMDQFKISLREGSIIASVRGPIDIVSELAGKPLSRLVVMGAQAKVIKLPASCGPEVAIQRAMEQDKPRQGSSEFRHTSEELVDVAPRGTSPRQEEAGSHEQSELADRWGSTCTRGDNLEKQDFDHWVSLYNECNGDREQLHTHGPRCLSLENVQTNLPLDAEDFARKILSGAYFDQEEIDRYVQIYNDHEGDLEMLAKRLQLSIAKLRQFPPEDAQSFALRYLVDAYEKEQRKLTMTGPAHLEDDPVVDGQEEAGHNGQASLRDRLNNNVRSDDKLETAISDEVLKQISKEHHEPTEIPARSGTKIRKKAAPPAEKSQLGVFMGSKASQHQASPEVAEASAAVPARSSASAKLGAGGAGALAPSAVLRKSPSTGQGTSEPPLRLLGFGSGGVDELRDLLPDADSVVRWAFLKFALGSGAFQRQKLLFLHVNGGECPAVKRGRANQHTDWVRSLICASESALPRGGGGRSETPREGGTMSSVSLSVVSLSEIIAEELLSKVANCFVKDDLGDVSVQWLTEESGSKHGRGSLATSAELEEERGCRMPGHSSSQAFTEGRDALKAVGDTWGTWNWLLLKPDPKKLQLVTGGDGGIDEMQEYAGVYQREVLVGVLRLSFGEGRLRRTKHVLVFTVGSEVGAIARGKLPMVRSQMEKALAEFVLVSCIVEVTTAEDLTMEAVIERVRRAAHIDDEVLDGDGGRKQLLSAEAYRQALQEERKAAMASAKERRKKELLDLSVRDAVKLMHADVSVNWGLFGLEEAAAAAPANKSVSARRSRAGANASGTNAASMVPRKSIPSLGQAEAAAAPVKKDVAVRRSRVGAKTAGTDATSILPAKSTQAGAAAASSAQKSVAVRRSGVRATVARGDATSIP